MKNFLRLLSILFCCATLAACSGEGDDPVAPDTATPLDAAAVDGAGDEATDEAAGAEKIDDMFAGADSEPAAAEGSDPLMNDLEETKPADASSTEGDGLFADLNSQNEPATGEGSGAEPANDDPLNFNDTPAETQPAEDASGDSFLDSLGSDDTSDPPAADNGGTDEIADLTGDGAPLPEPSSDGSQSLDDLLSGGAPASADGSGDLLDDLDATQDGASGATGEPQMAAKEFLGEIRSGNLATASRMIFSPAEPQWQDMVRKQVDKLHAEMQAGVTSIDVLEPRRQGDWVLVVCKVTTNRNGQPVDRVSDQYFCLVDSQWKMMPETVRSDSAGQSLVNDDFNDLAQWYQSNKQTLKQKYLLQ